MPNNKNRIHAIKYINNKKLFIKEYREVEIDLPKLIREEFQKGLELNKLINYPKPLAIKKNKIIYEFLDIKFSLADRLSEGKFDYTYFIKAAKFLRKIHNNNIVHGDFSLINIVITKDNRLYFIDASFSKFINQYKIIFRNKDIYQDISLFMRDLKWIRPLSKLWIIFQRKNIKKVEKCFLDIYFQGDIKQYDKFKCIRTENYFLKAYLKTIPEKEIFRRLIWKILILFIIHFNKRKINC